MSCVVQKTAVRGRFLDIKNTVSQAAQILDQVRYIEDGLLITEQGKITWFGPWEDAQSHLTDDIQIDHYPEQLIVPGFIDTHIHFPQTEMVGAYGEQLLEWLNTYTFPTEFSLQIKPMPTKSHSFLSKNYLKMAPRQHWFFVRYIPNQSMPYLKRQNSIRCV